mgnify:CR=1 FL=1
MKKLLITLMLISPFSFADWDDVYYCQMTTNSTVSLEGERTNHKLVKFTFKLDETKNAMVFGKDGFFNNSVFELIEGFSYPEEEHWRSGNMISISYFKNGKFIFASSAINIISISADCDKF